LGVRLSARAAVIELFTDPLVRSPICVLSQGIYNEDTNVDNKQGIQHHAINKKGCHHRNSNITCPEFI